MSEMSMFSGYASMKKSVLIWGVIIIFFSTFMNKESTFISDLNYFVLIQC